MRFLKFLLLFAFVATCVSQPLSAQPVIMFDGVSNTDTNIGMNTMLFSDTTSKLSFDDVRKHPELFHASTSDVPSFGVTNSTHWLHFKVANHGDRNAFIVDISYPVIDEISFYVINKSDTGKRTAKDWEIERRHKHQFFIYNVSVAVGDTVDCYLKVKSNKELIVPITITLGQDLVQFVSKSDIFSGLYLGIMAAMILYNLFIYFSARDKQYLYYVNYIFWVMMTQACLLGYPNRFVWTDNHSWIAKNSFTLFGAFSAIATVMFVKFFLQTRNNVPRLHFIMNLVIVVDSIAILLLLLGYDVLSYEIVNPVAALGALLILVTAIVVYPKNKKTATYFLVAWSVFLLSVVIFVLKDAHIFTYNFFTVHSVQIGSAIEAILLSFALADRINTLKREKDQSRLAALRIAKENSQIIKQQNVLLEQKVKERTEELELKNEILNTTLNELTETQMQLVESEKMASLGQLTAGIAHEINNPINFVTGNIGPLKRDVEALFGTIETLESYNSQNISDEEKKSRTKDYKEDLDFDYLKIEINHLLKGIHEGASRTAEIVKSLRIFSRLDEDDVKQANLNEGLESTLIIVNNTLSKIKVETEFADLPLINCYPGKLNQVFLNIIANGIFAINEKFNGQEGGVLKIKTFFDHQSVTVSISDNGTGMSEETKRKMFDPFYTTKDVGQGTGLGMSIAFNTIQKHDGKIQVVTEVGVGTTFNIILPLNELG